MELVFSYVGVLLVVCVVEGILRFIFFCISFVVKKKFTVNLLVLKDIFGVFGFVGI